MSSGDLLTKHGKNETGSILDRIEGGLRRSSNVMLSQVSSAIIKCHRTILLRMNLKSRSAWWWHHARRGMRQVLKV